MRQSWQIINVLHATQRVSSRFSCTHRDSTKVGRADELVDGISWLLLHVRHSLRQRTRKRQSRLTFVFQVFRTYLLSTTPCPWRPLTATRGYLRRTSSTAVKQLLVVTPPKIGNKPPSDDMCHNFAKHVRIAFAMSLAHLIARHVCRVVGTVPCPGHSRPCFVALPPRTCRLTAPPSPVPRRTPPWRRWPSL